MGKWHRPNSAENKPCQKCGEIVTAREPDPCIGELLPGIAHACCGHGNIEEAFCNGFDDCKPHDSVNRFDDEYVSAWLIRFDENNEPIEIFPNPEYTQKAKKNNLRPGFWSKKGQEAIEYMNSLKQK